MYLTIENRAGHSMIVAVSGMEKPDIHNGSNTITVSSVCLLAKILF
jgi:hypothetical protein